MKRSRITRISEELYKEILRLQKQMREQNGIKLSFVEASRLIIKKPKKWKFPEFT